VPTVQWGAVLCPFLVLSQKTNRVSEIEAFFHQEGPAKYDTNRGFAH
jgi:hypothetical protein